MKSSFIDTIRDFSLWSYRQMLRIFPDQFRERYGSLILSTIEDEFSHVSSVRKAVGLMFHIILDAFVSAGTEHYHASSRRDLRFKASALVFAGLCLAAVSLTLFHLRNDVTRANEQLLSSSQNAVNNVPNAEKSLTYTVDGTFRYKLQVPQYSQTQEYSFRLTVSNQLWAAKVHQVKASLRTGTDIKQVYNGDVRACIMPFQSPQRGADGFAFVKSGDLPTSDGFVRQLWLAYASQHIFARSETNRLEVLCRLDDRGAPARAPAEWTLSGTPPHLPASVTYFFDPADWDMLRFGFSSEQVELISKRSEPLILATYQSTGFTNASGISVPQGFRLAGYEPLNEIRNGSPQLVWELEAETKNVSVICDQALLESRVAGIYDVLDTRLLFSMHYRLVDAAIPNRADAFKLDDTDRNRVAMSSGK